MSFPTSRDTFTRPASGSARNVAPTETGSFSTLMTALEAVEGMLVGPTHYNVKDPIYGATGDGVTNDAAGIQAAADAINSAGGGTLYFPEGTYLVNTTVLLYSNTHVVGAGPGSIVQQNFAHSGIDTNGVFENANQATGNSNISFRNITVQASLGTGTPVSASTAAIAFNGVSDLSIMGCRFINGTVVLKPDTTDINTATVHTTGNNRRVRIIGNYFEAGAEAIYFQQGTDCVIQGNVCINAYDTTISVNSSGERIVISNNVCDKQGNTNPALAHVEFTNDGAGDSNGIRDIVVSGNSCLNGQNSACKGVQLQKVTQAVISNNQIRNNLGSGIFVNEISDSIVICGNVITVPAAGAHGIHVANDGSPGASNVNVIANVIISLATAGNGIALSGGTTNLSNVMVVGNRVQSVNVGINAAANVTNGVIAHNLLTGSSVEIASTGTGWLVNQVSSVGNTFGNNVIVNAGFASSNTTVNNLSVGGSATVAGNVVVGGGLASSNSTVANLSVAGSATVSSNLVVAGALASSNTTAINLSVLGSATFSSNLAAGNATVQSLRVNDALVVDNAGGGAALYFGSSLDVNLVRLAQDVLRTDDKFIAMAGLGVGNSSAATAVTGVARVTQAFSSVGTLLGYIPIYSTFS